MKLLQEFWKWFRQYLWSKPTRKDEGALEPPSQPAESPDLLQRDARQLAELAMDEATADQYAAPKASRITREKKTRFIQVGLDFGTSATKIAYSDLRATGRRVKPILFTHGLDHQPSYCLPSVVAFDSRGNLLLGIKAAQHLVDAPWNFGIRRLKVMVAGKYDVSFRDPTSDESHREYLSATVGEDRLFAVENLTTAFLGYTIHRARMALEKEYEGYELDVGFNVCVPIDHVENNVVKRAFDRILVAAEGLAKRWPEETRGLRLLELAEREFEQAENASIGEDNRVVPVPEAVAEVAAYSSSLEAPDKIHAVIDFGSGTTDLSIFNRVTAKRPDPTTGKSVFETRNWWYASRNLPRGTNRVEQIVADHLDSGSGDRRPVREFMILRELEQLDSSSEVLWREIKSELEGLRDEADSTWGEAFNRRRKVSHWEGPDKVRILICGGGSRSQLVPPVFSHPRRKFLWGPYEVSQIPTPRDYDSIDSNAPFARMVVAHGLCIPPEELGSYRLPKDCPDQTPEKVFKHIPDASQVDTLYPTPAWLGPRRGRR